MLWPFFPIKVEIYTIMIMAHDKAKFKHLEGIWMSSRNFKRYDPLGLVNEHFKLDRFSKSYEHEKK